MVRACLWMLPLVVALASFAACAQTEEASQAITPAQTPEASLAPSPEPVGSPLLPLGPPPPAYTCIYIVDNGQAVCQPLNGRSPFDICSPIQFGDRAACLPPGATYQTGINEYLPPIPTGAVVHFAFIRRGNSVVKWADRLLEYTVLPQDQMDFGGLREMFLPAGATPPPPPYPYKCRYIVVAGEAVCAPLDSAVMEGCRPMDFQDRSACLPPGAEFIPAVGEPTIKRGNSTIKFNYSGVIEYSVAPEDEADFSGLKELFRPGQ